MLPRPDPQPESEAPRVFQRVSRLSFGWVLAPVLLLAGGVRLAHLLAIRKLPLFEQLIIDSRSYDAWAQRIAGGEWLGDRAFYMDPLYPYALAVVYRLFGHDLLVARLVQAGIGVATCALVAFLGLRIGGRAVGLIAGLFIALYQPLVFEEIEIEKTGLGVAMVSAALLLFTRRSLGSLTGAGACLALAVLTRGNLILLVPAALAYLALAPAKRDPREGGFDGNVTREEASGLGDARRRGKETLAFAVGLALVLAPVVWRNHLVSGEWILTTSQSGQNFYTGNNPSNETGAYAVVPFVTPLPGHEEAGFRAAAERMSGRAMSPSEVSSFWFRKGLEHVQERPSASALVFLRKLVLTWSDIEIPDGWSVHFMRRYSKALGLAFLTMGWLVPLAALGALGHFRRSRDVRLLVGYVALYTVSLVAFFVLSRYRIYLIPAVAVLAALGTRWAWEVLRRRDWRTAFPMVVTGALLATLSFAGENWVGIDRAERIAYNFSYLADAHSDRGEYGAAEGLLLEQLSLQPGRASILVALGSLRMRSGDLSGAIQVLEEASGRVPSYPNIWYILAVAYQKAGRMDEAKESLRRQLEVTPNHQTARARLQSILGQDR